MYFIDYFLFIIWCVSGAMDASDFGQNEQLLLQASIKLNSTQVGIGYFLGTYSIINNF